MTAAEYGSMKTQAMTALQQLREKGISGDDIGILMSREVYDMARLGDDAAYAVSIENFRSVYWGYDIYVIAENAPPIFSPVIVRFLEDFDLFQFDAGTFLISESDDGALRVFTKPTQDHAFFIETEFTVYQGRQTERVTFADRFRAGRDHPPRPWYNREGHTDWQDLMRYRQLAESSIDQYKQHYQELNAYCKHGELRSIDENTLLEFLRSQYDVHITSLHVKGLDRVAGNHIRPFTVLNWYLMTGEINTRVRVRNPLFICPEGFCDSYEAFMEYLRQKDLASSTVRNYRETVQQFIRHMISIGGESSEMISPAGILSFLSAFKHFSTNSFSYLITGIRQYLSFLFCSGFLDEDLSETLPQVKKPRYAGIPHIWSKEELKAILNAVDRMSPTGKRDYAIMLLVIQTGFRAADIRRLKLKDIDWKGHKIRITTAKNGQELELPLLESTGWAIIDYLQNGRPKTDCDCVFTRHIAPYGPIGSTSGLDFALGRYIMKAGIKFKKGERHGLHTLRNSLAKNMLDAGAPLPVISQTLGHQNVNTTAIYLKIDIDGLRKCALDISEWEV